jgi:hypothetical protein
MVPLARVGVPRRHHQLVARLPGLVEQFARVVVSVRQQVAAAPARPQATEHLARDGRLAHFQRGYFPLVGQGSVRPSRVQLVALGHHAGRPAVGGVGIFGVAADRQWLAVEQGDQGGRRAEAAEAFLEGVPEQADADGVGPATHGGGRG